MEERLRFIARLLDGEGMSGVCREFGISRKTGYKIVDLIPNAYDGTDKVALVTDSGSVITGYLDGALTNADSYTRSSTLTVNRFALGAQVRTTTGNWFPARVYALVIVKRVLDASERASLVTYLGAKERRTL